MWERYRERYRKSILYRAELGIGVGVGKARIFGEIVPKETEKQNTNRITKKGQIKQ